MPVPILVGVAAIASAIESALAGVTIGGLVAAATATIAGLLSAEAIMEWLDSKAGAELVAEQLNKQSGGGTRMAHFEHCRAVAYLDATRFVSRYCYSAFFQNSKNCL